MLLAGLVARMGEMGNLHEILVGKTNGRISLVRGGSLWEDNIKMGLNEIVCEYVDWIDLAHHGDQWRAFVKGITKRPSASQGGL
jgi:hypothetical protein